MRPQNLQEFAEQLKLQGCEFADEILELVSLEEDVAQPYSEICNEFDHQTPDEMKGKWEKQLEWLGDRSRLLGEIEDLLSKHDRAGDADDEIMGLLGTLENIETILRRHGGWSEGDLQDALFALIERAEKAPSAMEYDL